jgi:hypothetical protein
VFPGRHSGQTYGPWATVRNMRKPFEKLLFLA